VSGPGRYLPDVTEGSTRPEDLPKAKIIDRSRNFTHRPCPVCGRSCFRSRTGKRILHDIGDLVAGRPRDIHLVYSHHRCTQCHKYFNADMADYALPKAHYTHRVVSLAVRLVVAVRASTSLYGWEANLLGNLVRGESGSLDLLAAFNGPDTCRTSRWTAPARQRPGWREPVAPGPGPGSA
jgi:hypothetical protein